MFYAEDYQNSELIANSDDDGWYVASADGPHGLNRSLLMFRLPGPRARCSAQSFEVPMVAVPGC